MIIKNLLFLLCMLSHFDTIGQIGKSYRIRNDTISSKLNFCNGILDKGYFNIKNVFISKDYNILDSFSLYINKDKILDMILVLNPIVNGDFDTAFTDCRLSKFNKRLFVVLIGDKNGEYATHAINEDIILTERDFIEEPYLGTTKTQTGFTIEYYIKSWNICYCTLYFNIKNGDIFLTSKKYYCMNQQTLNGFEDSSHVNNIKIDNVNIKKYLNFKYIK